MEIDPDDRISLEEALNHEFFHENSPNHDIYELNSIKLSTQNSRLSEHCDKSISELSYSDMNTFLAANGSKKLKQNNQN